MVSEVQQTGWVQTSPPTVKYTYEITAGEVFTSADFGNAAACQNPESEGCEAGQQDDFDGSDGPEPASPSAELLAFLQSCSDNPQTEFDRPTVGRCFGHTFDKDSGDSCLSHDCLIVGATITIHLKATGNGSGDDMIGFMQNGVYVWATEISNLPEAGTTWNNGQSATFTLDLANLPADQYGLTNILATLQDGDLDVYVQDDTMVDYITLDVEYCCGCQTNGEIHGQKFHDLNGNGIKDKDPGEPGLAGWTIELEDANGNVQSIVTDANGNYWFMNLPSGTYTVSEEMQDGWTQTFPLSGTHTVVLEDCEVLEGFDFGNWQEESGEIHGQKFHDENGNGVKDLGELGLSGWTILLLDANGNVISSTVTDSNGNYWFMDLPPGTYTLAELFQEPGWIWQQTTPQGTHTIEVGAGEIIENVDFGNWQEGKDDYCSINWDTQFVNEEPLTIDVNIRNTSDTPEKAYTVEMIGLPAGTMDSNADGPTTFDILTPLPITLDPDQSGAVGVDVHYPPSFANGEPGPALFQAIVTNLTTGTSFGCQAALWPVTDVQPDPVMTDTVTAVVGEPLDVEFTLENVGETDRTVDWTISAMSQGMSGNSPIVTLNDLPAGEVVNGERTLAPSESIILTVRVEFLEHAPLGKTDILLTLDIDQDGTTDVIVSSAVSSAKNMLFLPLITK